MKDNQTAQETNFGSQNLESPSLAIHLPGQPSHREQIPEDIASHTHTLRKHLDRLFRLEEVENYLNLLAETRQESSGQVANLHAEYAAFRRTFDELMACLDALVSEEPAKLDAIYKNIHDALCRILQHGRVEGQVLIQDLKTHEGGEGYSAGKGANMDEKTKSIIHGLVELRNRPNAAPDIAMLADSMLTLYQRVAGLHQDDLQAFEQIEELDRRQGAGDR